MAQFRAVTRVSVARENGKVPTPKKVFIRDSGEVYVSVAGHRPNIPNYQRGKRFAAEASESDFESDDMAVIEEEEDLDTFEDSFIDDSNAVCE